MAAPASVVSTAATAAFVAVHAFAAQRFATGASLALATLAWFAAAYALQMVAVGWNAVLTLLGRR